jgi:hypothetical protein
MSESEALGAAPSPIGAPVESQMQTGVVDYLEIAAAAAKIVADRVVDREQNLSQMVY